MTAPPNHGDEPALPIASTSRILIVDDHPLFRFGLKQLINAQDDMTVCGEAPNAVAGLDQTLRLRPDLITVDISLNASANGLEFVKNVKSHVADIRIVIVSMHDEFVYALRALRAGAQGYVMKRAPLDQIVAAFRTVLGGGIFLSEALRQQVLVNLAHGTRPPHSPVDALSDRELEILQLSGQGLTPREIAGQLSISVKTVETHRMHIRGKLKLANSAELTRYAIAWIGQNEAKG